MELEIYDKTANKEGMRRSYYRTINVGRKGTIVLSAAFAKDEQIGKGVTAYVARDADSGNWFIRFEIGGDGMMVRAHTEKQRCGALMWRFGCKAVAMRLTDEAGAKKSCTLLVSKTATTIDGTKWYQILTKKPLRVN